MEVKTITGTTGNSGSVLVPQYQYCKISVFVWVKGTILKSLKITLQLLVVVLKTHTKFCDNIGHNRRMNPADLVKLQEENQKWPGHLTKSTLSWASWLLLFP